MIFLSRRTEDGRGEDEIDGTEGRLPRDVTVQVLVGPGARSAVYVSAADENVEGRMSLSAESTARYTGSIRFMNAAESSVART